MDDGINGFANSVENSTAALKALGVTKITYSFVTDKWSVTIPNPEYGTKKKDAWGYSRYNYTKSRTVTAKTLEQVIILVSDLVKVGVDARVKELKDQAAQALKSAETMRKNAIDAEEKAKTLLAMIED